MALRNQDACVASTLHRDEGQIFQIALSIMYLGDCLLDAKLWTEKMYYLFKKLLYSDNSKNCLRSHLKCYFSTSETCESFGSQRFIALSTMPCRSPSP